MHENRDQLEHNELYQLTIYCLRTIQSLSLQHMPVHSNTQASSLSHRLVHRRAVPLSPSSPTATAPKLLKTAPNGPAKTDNRHASDRHSAFDLLISDTVFHLLSELDLLINNPATCNYTLHVVNEGIQPLLHMPLYGDIT